MKSFPLKAAKSRYGVLFTVLLLTLASLLPNVTSAQTCPNFAYNLDQGKNGKSDSPINPINWVNGNLNASQSHYVEGYSIPYRAILTGLTPGTCFVIRIEWDIKHSGVHAIDYVTSYPNCTNSLMDNPSHMGSFMHGPECVDPVINTTLDPTVFSLLEIPSPTYNISATGMNGITAQQPVTSFNLQAEANRKLTLFGGTLDSASYPYQGDFALAQSAAAMDIYFVADNDSAVLAWGGHIGSRLEWGLGNSAGNISGSPYHMRVIGMRCCNITTLSGGNQDRSLQAQAVLPPPTIMITLEDTVCTGEENTLTITTSDPANTTYAWSISDPGTTGASFVGATNTQQAVVVTTGPGDYTVCASLDINGYLVDTCRTIHVRALPNCSISGDGLVCNGGSSVFMAGAADSYLWSTGETTQSINVGSTGTYTVTLTDIYGCSNSCDKDLAYSDVINLGFGTTPVNCYGGSDGAVDLTASGGYGTLYFLWSNGSTTEDISGLTAGTYTVTVTDDNGCTATGSANVLEPNAALGLQELHSDVSCNGGSDGSINLTVSGGTPAYSYLWSNGSTDEDISGLAAGNYNVVVTDANGCTAGLNVNIGEPTAINIGEQHTNVACNGGNDGTIDLTVSGGTPGYSYLWNDGNTDEDRSSLSAGTYTVTVTDNNGCTASTSVTISQAGSLLVGETHSNVQCNGGNDGSIDVTVSGGTPGYSYLWNDGPVTEDRSNLTAGTYTITVTDANGCSAVQSATITQPSTLTTLEQHGNVACNGGSDGFINLTVNGGTTPYDFAWSNGATTEDISGLAAGAYTVTVTDDHGCTATRTVQISEPPVLNIVSGNVTDVACNGESTGSIDITVSGGTPPYDYSWSNGAITQDLNGLSAGTYTVVVTDDHGCSATQSYQVNEPTALSVQTVGTDVTCNNAANGSIDATVSGGTPAYAYAWSNGATTEDISGLAPGTYTIVVTDDNGCTATSSASISQPTALALQEQHTDETCNENNDGAINLGVSGGTPGYSFAWSNGAITEDISGLAAGTYTVTVTDANNCTATLSVSISQPDVLAIQGSATDAACNGTATGSVDITVSGGTPSYSYLWSNGATTEDIASVGAGTYTVTVTDDNGCTATETYVVSQPSTLTLSADSTDVSCNGGSDGAIDITVSGGTMPYSYGWSNGATTEDISGLTAGVYTVVVADNNGCSVTQSFNIDEPTALQINGNANDVQCNGGSDGSIDITVSGGSPGYTYAWSNGATTEDISGLSAGSYTVTVTDSHNCTASMSFIVNEPTVLSLNGNATDALCNGGTGSVDITVSGGTPAYAYAWSNGATTEDISGVAAGTYTVTVTDDNGCTATNMYTVGEPDAIVIQSKVDDVLCNGASDGAIDITVTGGTSPYSYAWSNGATTEDLTGLAAGTYTVTVTDDNGCTASMSFTVNEPSMMSIGAKVDDAACYGYTGNIDITVTGGTPAYSYLWSNGATTEDLTGVPAGTYTVTVTDDNGCTKSMSWTINEPDQLIISVSGECSPCNIPGEAMANVIAAGGTPPLTYLWSTGATTTTITNLFSGTYTVTATDANGCFAQDSVTLDCDPHCQFKTFTMGGWGAVPNGNNPGVYLHNNFAGAFPGGLTIGCNNNLSLSSAQAVTDFLPSGSTASMLPAGNLFDPGQSYSNVLAGQLVAATLSVTFDDYDPNFSIEPITLGTLEIGSGPFMGWTVYQLLDSANNFIGGCGSNYSASQFNSALTAVNEDFDNGNVHVGYLICPNEMLTATVHTTDVSCGNKCDGTASVTPMYGTAPYYYMWSTGAQTASVSGLCQGTYTVTIEDQNKCATVITVVIGGPDALKIRFKSVTSCTDPTKCDGAIDAKAVGGVGPYTYKWHKMEQNGVAKMGTSEDLSGLCPGTYRLRVLDTEGCIKYRKVDVGSNGTLRAAINEDSEGVSPIAIENIFPSPANESVSIVFNATEDGTADVKVFDITGRVVMNIDHYSFESGLSQQIDLDVTQLTVGAYMVVIQHNGDITTGKFNIAR